jgi:predicted enzyme related to lactoylglutathione lyase
MASEVTHFEVFAEEPAKLADFYRELFGWQVEKAPGVDYWRIRAGTNDAAINGGLTRRAISSPGSWVHYVNVASIDDTVRELERLGGRVVRGKTGVANTGWFAVLADPEQNIFAVWQPDPLAFALPEAG